MPSERAALRSEVKVQDQLIEVGVGVDQVLDSRFRRFGEQVQGVVG
jgi:hypothetical protein